jgi:hypothetical protein
MSLRTLDACDFGEIAVEPAGIDLLQQAILIFPGEQLPAGKIGYFFQNPLQPGVLQAALDALSTLCLEPQFNTAVDELVEFLATAQGRPVAMIAILFVAPDIESCRLQVSIILHAYPDVSVGRRQAKGCYSLPLGFVTKKGAVRQPVAKSLSFPKPPDAGFGVADVNEPQGFDR